MMGTSHDIDCTVSGVESTSVMINWSRIKGSNTKKNRLTSSPIIYSGNTSLQFMYLVQGGVGMYICNVTALDVNGSQSVEIQSITSKLSTPSKHILYHKI